MKLNKITVSMLIFLAGNSYASEDLPLESINVSANAEALLSGHTLIKQAELAKSIHSDKNINELVQHKNAVRTSAGSYNGATQGEITPKALSFYGERYYNNNFMLNNIGINDQINPIGMGKEGILERDKTYTVSADALPSGHPQAFWISPDLLEQVEIYDSNVPSEFGSFTGGVVNAKLKEPNSEKAFGSVSYRTTRDRWTKHHFDGDYVAEFEQAYTPLQQPKFIKNQYNFIINQPVRKNSGLLFSYDLQQSRIPQQQRYLNQWVKQKRKAETFLLAYSNQINPNNNLKASLIYSPHSGSYFLDNAKNGRFVESGGGWLGELSWKNYNSLGLLTTTLSYRNNKNRTDYDADHLYRYTKTKSIDWVSDPGTQEATLGGIGKRFTRQQQWQIKQQLEFEPLTFGTARHSWKLGWEAQHNLAEVKQKRLSIIYSGAKNQQCYEDSNASDGYRCEPFSVVDCIDCVSGEQYFTAKQHIYPVNARVKHHRAALYLQDQIDWKDFKLVPGVRLDYAQFTKRLNIAPRFYVDYDLLGKDQTHFIVGFNRYHAGDLLDYKLRSAYKFSDNYMRTNYADGWTLESTYQYIRYPSDKKLKTPYSDEINVGIKQKIMNSIWELKWVQRHSKDQLMTQYDTESKPNTRRLVNEGRSKTHNIGLDVANLTPINTDWAVFNWKFGISYQKTKTNQTTDYTQGSWLAYGIDKVLLNNKLQHISKTPAVDFNTPVTAHFKLSTYFPKLGLTWQQQLNYYSGRKQGSLKGLKCSAEIEACGNYRGRVAGYQSVYYKRNITLDWYFDWQIPITENQSVSIDLSVLNVLNRVAKAERKTDNFGESYFQTYHPGRQFWLGVKYQW